MTALKPEQAAKALNCHLNTVYTLIRKGKIRAFKFGGRALRIEPDELERFKQCGLLNIEDTGASTTQLHESDNRYVPMTE